MARKEGVDWEAVEMRYRGGTESLRSIAAAFGITEGAIRKRAKTELWARDLSAKVKAATDLLLVRKASTHEVRTERVHIAVEAEMRSEVVLAHRKDIARSRGMFQNLMGKLETLNNPEGEQLVEMLIQTTAPPREGEDEEGARKRIARAKKLLDEICSVPSVVDSFKRLVETHRHIIALEREAFGITSDAEDESAKTAQVLNDAERASRAGAILALAMQRRAAEQLTPTDAA